MKKQKGIFMVIDGLDGTGKATQTKILKLKLKRIGINAQTIDFPGYRRNIIGRLIGECLQGKYGDFLTIDPHIVSVLYAVDRFESAKKINSWLNDGKIVIADRYVSANQIHQGGKIKNPIKRRQFLKWLDKMEYGIFKLPRPDVVFYLNLPLALSAQLISIRQGKNDLSDKDHIYQKKSANSATAIVKQSNNWQEIDCSYQGKVLSREEIAEALWQKVKKIIEKKWKLKLKN